MTHLGERPGYGQGALPFCAIPTPCGSALWDPDLSGRKSWRYSPECVEGEFCEVRMQHHRADLLRSPKGSEVPEGPLERSLVVQPTCVCQAAKLLKSYLVGIEQDFADHQSTTTLEHAA
jgi:hypothetical protein